MTPRVEVLKQLVADELYVIDESAVAHAVLLRAAARGMVPGVSFRSSSRVVAASGFAPAVPGVRSFRPHRGARSFRLSRSERRPQHAAGVRILVAG